MVLTVSLHLARTMLDGVILNNVLLLLTMIDNNKERLSLCALCRCRSYMTKETFEYDPLVDKWSQKATMPGNFAGTSTC